jgi:hypothetical protein
MRIAMVAGGGAGDELSDRLARSGNEVALAPGVLATAAPPHDVLLLVTHASRAEATIEAARGPMGRESFVVGLVGDAIEGPGLPHEATVMRLTLGELDHVASARVVRLARAFQEAGVEAEVSLDIHAAIARLRAPQRESAGGDGSEACRRC